MRRREFLKGVLRAGAAVATAGSVMPLVEGSTPSTVPTASVREGRPSAQWRTLNYGTPGTVGYVGDPATHGQPMTATEVEQRCDDYARAMSEEMDKALFFGDTSIEPERFGEGPFTARLREISRG